jgi:glutathione S-transferase
MTDALPVLYSFRRCPYAMRSRLALAVSQQACALREIVLSQKPPEMLRASPKGTVPVLVLANGQVLEQSLDIMQWALQQSDPSGWLPSGVTDALRCHKLIAECDGPFKGHLDRYKYPHRYDLPDGLEHRDQGAKFLMQLEEQLMAAPYLHGTHFGLADAAIAPFVRQFAHTNPAWFAAQHWPSLQRWLQRFEASPLFAHTMVKFARWTPEQSLTVFP